MGEEMDIGGAIASVKNGRVVRRLNWNGKGMWIGLRSVDEMSDMTLPYIYLRTADGKYVPWLASQTDLLAEDWVKV